MSARAWKRRRAKSAPCAKCGGSGFVDAYLESPWGAPFDGEILDRPEACDACEPAPKSPKRQGRARIEQRARERRQYVATFMVAGTVLREEGSRQWARWRARGKPGVEESCRNWSANPGRRLSKHLRGAAAKRARESQQRADERRGT